MRALRLWLWPAGAAVGIAAEWVYFGWDDPEPSGCPISPPGGLSIACGLVGWARRPESRSGPLLAATGFAWFAANLLGDAGSVPPPRAPDPAHPDLSVRTARIAARSRRRRGRVRRRARSGGLVERHRHVRAVRALRAGRGPRLRRAVGRERRTRRAAFGATAFVGAVLAGSAAARLAVPTAELDGRDAARLRGRAVHVGRRAAGGPRRAAVDAHEGHRPRRRSRPDGLRHAARRARRGAWRSHARGRLLAR